jgi:hypothetical protein
MNAPQLIDRALHAYPKLCSDLGLQGLACLGASSKSLRDTSISILHSQARELIELAVKSAEETQLQWVLEVAPAAAAGAAEHLVRMPAVPLNIAKILVAAGVRISYARLIAGANSLAAGVEVWVQAQQQLGVNSDIPSVAEAICCCSTSHNNNQSL